MIYKVFDALLSLKPGKQWTWHGEEYSGLIWHESDTPPTEAEIDAKFKSMLDDWEAKQYQRDRSISYPSIQDQLDMLYWDRKNGTKTWEESIDKVKADIPKPE